MQRIVAICMRLMFACGSFHHIKVIGQKAEPKEAPILVVAPHSSYLDSMISVIMRPTIVAKKESADIPIVGSKETNLKLLKLSSINFAKIPCNCRNSQFSSTDLRESKW